MSKPVARIYFVRHGETQENKEGIIQGQKDTALNATGEEQARMVGERLKEEKIDWAVSSDLQRAVKTAEAILVHHGDVRLDTDAELRERNMGSMEGRRGKDMRLESMEGGETVGAFRERTIRWWNRRIVSRRKRGETQTVLICTHGGLITTLVSALVGSRKAYAGTGVVVSGKCLNGSVTVVEVGEDGKGLVTAYGDISHLSAHHSSDNDNAADFIDNDNTDTRDVTHS